MNEALAPEIAALHEASAALRRALEAAAVGNAGWPVAIATTARSCRRAAAQCEQSHALDLFMCAVTAVETGIRESDQATLDAGARLLHVAAEAITKKARPFNNGRAGLAE